MRDRLFRLAGVLLLAATASGLPAAQAGNVTSGTGPTFEYIGPLTFGPGDVLFAADSQDVSIYAVDLGAALQGAVPGTRDVPDIEGRIAALLGTAASRLTITDLAVHPRTRNAFISAMRGRGADAQAVLLRVDGAGTIAPVALDRLPYTKVRLPNPPGEVTPLVLQGGREFPVPNYPKDKSSEGPLRLFGVQTITDMAYTDGRLYVSGLSNEEFASNLRSIAYPFQNVDAGTSVEIWHAPHGQFETRSPVYTFVPYRIDGEPHLIASYLCTPLVKFPVSSLKPNADVRGVTIGEFGNGNRPLDMIVYRKDGREFLLMSNNVRGVMKIPTAGFSGAPAITAPVPNGSTAGVSHETIPSMNGVEQLDLLDDTRALVLARAEEGGTLNLSAVALP
jgi:hypothetical protein